jgi:hypothetical protein
MNEKYLEEEFSEEEPMEENKIETEPIEEISNKNLCSGCRYFKKGSKACKSCVIYEG